MTQTRVHELAKEFGSSSKAILERLKDLGCFAKSASSSVKLEDELLLRRAVAGAAESGVTPEQFLSRTISPQDVPASATDREVADLARERSPKRRRNSWEGSPMADAEHVWRRVGLGDNDAGLASFLLDHGILPTDLSVEIRGTRAINRFRSGEASWHVLVDELKEARDQLGSPQTTLPDTKAVTRRRVR